MALLGSDLPPATSAAHFRDWYRLHGAICFRMAKSMYL